MHVAVAILAAGRSSRLGLDKTLEPLRGKPVWRWSYETYLAHPEVSEVFVVVSADNLSLIQPHVASVTLGGGTREESAAIALASVKNADVLLFHDAGRPFVDHATISRTLNAIRRIGAAAASVPVKDTIREVENGVSRTLNRSNLIAMQTPQGGRIDLLRKAFAQSDGLATDEASLFERAGIDCAFVPGNDLNFKITTMEDLITARNRVADNFPRVGSGYDVHSFSDDPARILKMGGVTFENARGLEGHSDADVLLHAITDALLGAACLGDIGQHFPNTDPAWKNAPSLQFLVAAKNLLQAQGWQIVNIDSTVIAEEPKIMKKAIQIRETIASALDLRADQISVKATTNEKMGFIGRSEGIAAFATAMIAPA
jgi:2-C-methyl-D-erythritol 4-phosphate cytidylyltransferase/2-C-methyl-D-erythritol 2,4-cyclodiphosphate synthase